MSSCASNTSWCGNNGELPHFGPTDTTSTPAIIASHNISVYDAGHVPKYAYAPAAAST